MGPFAEEVVEGARGGVADGNAYRGFRVVGVVNVHPHHIFFCVLVVDNFWPLEHIGFVEVVSLVFFLSCEDNALVFPCPEILGRVATDSDDINLNGAE